MKDHVSKIAFTGVILLPAVLFVLLPYTGARSSFSGNDLEQVSFLNTTAHQTKIIYFGYAGCSFICPPALFTLGAALDTVYAAYPEASLGAFFVDINANTQILRAEEYSSAFSSRIRGVNADTETLNSIKKSFGLNTMTGVRVGEDILHPDLFFVVQRNATGWHIVHQIAGSTSKGTLITILRSYLSPSST